MVSNNRCFCRWRPSPRAADRRCQRCRAAPCERRRAVTGGRAARRPGFDRRTNRACARNRERRSACAGGCFGIVVAIWGVRLFQSVGGGVAVLQQATIDTRVLAMAFLLTLIAGVVAGALPAWRSTRIAVSSLNSGARATMSETGSRQAIVCVQIAMATALVIGGVLLMRSFTRLLDVDVGFESDRALLADVSLPAGRYPKDGRASFFRDPSGDPADAGCPGRWRRRSAPALRTGWSAAVRPPRRGTLRRRGAGPRLPAVGDPRYFGAMRIPLTAGRAFTGGGSASSPARRLRLSTRRWRIVFSARRVRSDGA